MLAIGLAISVVAAVLAGGWAGRSALLRQSPRPLPAPAVAAPSAGPTATPSQGTFAYEAWTTGGGQSGFISLSDQVTSVDWSGQQRASLDLHTPQNQKGHAWQASPDGSLLLAMGVDGESIYDPTGQLVAKVQNFGIWASDDDIHGCFSGPGPSPSAGSLQVSTVDAANQKVSQVSVPIQGFAPGDQERLIQCSVARDEAVVFQVGAGTSGPFTIGPIALDVVQLSTGKVLHSHAYAGQTGVNAIVSPDGRYVAEPGQSGTSAIRDLASDQVVGHVDGRAVGFSSDGSRAVVVGAVSLQQPRNGVSVVEWRTSNVVWSHPSATAAQVVARPGSQDLALELVSAGAPGDVYLVPAAGGGRLIAKDGAPVARVMTLSLG